MFQSLSKPQTKHATLTLNDYSNVLYAIRSIVNFVSNKIIGKEKKDENTKK